MAKYLGNALSLAIEDSPSSGTYTVIAGASEHTMTINNEQIDVSDKDSNRWKSLLAAGARTLTISMNGFVSDDVEFELMRVAARDDVILNYRLTYGNSDTVTGAFHIDSFEVTGAYNNAQSFTATLSNSGEPTLT